MKLKIDEFYSVANFLAWVIYFCLYKIKAFQLQPKIFLINYPSAKIML